MLQPGFKVELPCVPTQILRNANNTDTVEILKDLIDVLRDLRADILALGAENVEIGRRDLNPPIKFDCIQSEIAAAGFVNSDVGFPNTCDHAPSLRIYKWSSSLDKNITIPKERKDEIRMLVQRAYGFAQRRKWI